MKKSKLIIIGMGEQGGIIEQIVKNNSSFQFIGYVDDDKYAECLGKVNSLEQLSKTDQDLKVFIAIGRNLDREKMFMKVKDLNIEFANIIHPSATVETKTSLGRNVFIGVNAIINYNSVIGDGVYINSGCIVEHDNVIGKFAHLAPGVITGGGVVIGEKTFLGIGSRINDHLSIGGETLVASGSVVIDPIGPRGCVGGIPAKNLVIDKKVISRYI